MTNFDINIPLFIAKLQCTVKLATKSGNGFKLSFQLSVAGCYKDVAESPADRTVVIADKYRRGIDAAVQVRQKLSAGLSAT